MVNRMRRTGSILGFILAGAALAQAEPESLQNPEALAKDRIEIALRLYRNAVEQLTAPMPDSNRGKRNQMLLVEDIVLWSKRWMEAERDASDGRAGRIAAMETHLKRIKDLEKAYMMISDSNISGASVNSIDTLIFHRLEAEYWLAKAKAEL